MSGTSTVIHPGSRGHGSRKAAAAASSSSTLASTAGQDGAWSGDGRARLASASTATMANGATRAHSPGPRNGDLACLPGGTEISGSEADSALEPIYVTFSGVDWPES